MPRAAVTCNIDPKSLREFNAAIGRLKAFATDSGSARTRESAPRILRQEMGLLVRKCHDFTPPFTLSGGTSQARKIGENAITGDLRKIVEVQSHSAFQRMQSAMAKQRAKTKKSFDKLQAEGLLAYLGIEWTPDNLSQARSLTKSMGTAEGVIKWFVDKGAALLPSHHQKSRRPSDGRVMQTKGQRAGVVIGVQKYLDILIVKQSDFNRYAKTIWKHVGKAKAGWNAAANMFKARGIPAWVKRHGNTGGTAADTIRNGNGYLEAVNRIEYIGRLDGRTKIVENAIKSRIQAIGLKLEKAMAYEAARFGK